MTSVPTVAGIPVDFILFALTLAGVALFHHHTLRVAVIGLVVITLYKLMFSHFGGVPGVGGLLALLGHEWVTVANLFGLLLGFALLSRHFEKSQLPALLPLYLPAGWKGGFVMLVLVFVLSSFLDNIAAAMIGGTMATALFQGRLHIGFLAAIVAASNAGGSGSVVGDTTTTTMMWIAGVKPLQVLDAYIASVPALLFFGVFAARQQHFFQPITKDAPAGIKVDWSRLVIVGAILLAAIGANVYFNLHRLEALAQVPVIALAAWSAILLTGWIRWPDWSLLPGATRGSIFLLSLVLCASMMPVEHLPGASWQTALGLGFVSAAFDNIPLTALALHQGGYDWGFLAYAVGFGGSMIWFCSSAGVALAGMFPQARSVGAWVIGGWHVAVGCLIGFACLLFTLSWHLVAALRQIPSTTAPAAAPARPPFTPKANHEARRTRLPCRVPGHRRSPARTLRSRDQRARCGLDPGRTHRAPARQGRRLCHWHAAGRYRAARGLPGSARGLQPGGRLQHHRRAGLHRARRARQQRARCAHRNHRRLRLRADDGRRPPHRRKRALPAQRRVDEMERRCLRRRRRAWRHARRARPGPHRPGHRTARRARLRHEGDLPQPLEARRVRRG